MADAVVNKPVELSAIIPDTISECAIFLEKKTVCSGKIIFDIATALNIADKDPDTILDKAKEKLNCDTEACVLKKMSATLGDQLINVVIKTNFKITGPTDNTLLNNYNIDNTLKQFQIKYPQFFAYNFNMINYRDYSFIDGRTYNTPDTLETIQVGDLIGRYNCAGCVINTDTYQGNGKHWMALFADWRDPENATVEFFNSSGNAPASAWILWMTRARDAIIKSGAKIKKIRDKAGFDSDIVKVASKRHQESKSECGVYSVFYIYARLYGVPVEYFINNMIPDYLMFEFRQHLFDGDNEKFLDKAMVGGKVVRKFNWNKYKENVNIKWEK
jgi:hypothetical protein